MTSLMLSRRSALANAAVLGAASLIPGEGAAAARFSFEGLCAEARRRAGLAYAPPPAAGPALQALGPEAAAAVQFRADRTLFAGAGEARVRLFSVSRQFPDAVRIFLLEAGRSRELAYSPDFFSAPAESPFHRFSPDAGFAGFRVLNVGRDSDWMAFLGASYFRTAGAFDQYGASARGLSLNAGGPGPEEFPRFTAFWLEPQGGASLDVYALLEGPSVTGAYKIASRKDQGGVHQSVRAALFFRLPARNLGLAPLTSMFWYGEGGAPSRRTGGPQVHDSDGLSLWTGAGERLWRPLDNPPRVVTNAFLDRAPRGFGLLQRDRSADHYQDRQAFYEKRPNLWVRPGEGFATGSVRLVEIPTDRDTTDNIVAYWSPSAQPKAGEGLSFAYDLDWIGQDPSEGSLARARSTRVEPPGPAGARRVVLDFEGQVLEGLEGAGGVEAVVTGPGGLRLKGVSAQRAPGAVGLWRVVFEVRPDGAAAMDLRAFLRAGERTLSETWTDQIFLAP